MALENGSRKCDSNHFVAQTKPTKTSDGVFLLKIKAYSIFKIFYFVLDRERETDRERQRGNTGRSVGERTLLLVRSLSCLQSPGLGWTKASDCELGSDPQLGWQEPQYLSNHHCLQGLHQQEPESSVGPRQSDVGWGSLNHQEGFPLTFLFLSSVYAHAV